VPGAIPVYGGRPFYGGTGNGQRTLVKGVLEDRLTWAGVGELGLKFAFFRLIHANGIFGDIKAIQKLISPYREN